MTNLEYIKSQMTDRILADLFTYNYKSTWEKFNWKVIKAFHKWANSFGEQKGNYVENGQPSVWMWEIWHYPDGHKEKKGQPRNVAFQTWLCHQYNKDDWE